MQGGQLSILFFIKYADAFHQEHECCAVSDFTEIFLSEVSSVLSEKPILMQGFSHHKKPPMSLGTSNTGVL